jgi:hypothetical protein
MQTLLEVYEYMMCRLVLSVFLQYQMNGKDLINSWPVMLNPTVMIPNKFIYVWT